MLFVSLVVFIVIIEINLRITATSYYFTDVIILNQAILMIMERIIFSYSSLVVNIYVD